MRKQRRLLMPLLFLLLSAVAAVSGRGVAAEERKVGDCWADCALCCCAANGFGCECYCDGSGMCHCGCRL